MPTTLILIKQVEWIKNPANTNEATLLQVQAAKSVTGVIASGADKLCGVYLCGEVVSTETPLTP